MTFLKNLLIYGILCSLYDILVLKYKKGSDFMNIIRTKAVELTSIPAIAYKQKLSSGGAGIKLIRLDQDISAVLTLDKRSGDLVPYGSLDEDIFPMEALDEALELTSGLPYSARGKIKIIASEQPDKEDIAEEATEQGLEKIDIVNSEEYKAIVFRYSDENDKMNYPLMNKDFTQFASKSKTVTDLVANNASVEDILTFIIKNRAGYISGNKEALDDTSVLSLIETLDEINPRSTFKELKAYIIRLLAKNKRK